MRIVLLLLTILMFALPSWAGDSDSAARTKFHAFLKKMDKLESQAKSIQPMHIGLDKRTREQDKEMTRRIEFLDNLHSKEIPALGREIKGYRDFPTSMQLRAQDVGDAFNALDVWVDAKLSLQNAGVKNPSLESLRKNEPLRYKEYRAAREKAEAGLKS